MSVYANAMLSLFGYMQNCQGLTRWENSSPKECKVFSIEKNDESWAD